MISARERFVVDENGQPVAVLLDIECVTLSANLQTTRDLQTALG